MCFIAKAAIRSPPLLRPKRQRFGFRAIASADVGTKRTCFLSQSVCGGSSSSLSLAVSIAMRISASVGVRFDLNASSSYVSVPLDKFQGVLQNRLGRQAQV